MNILQISAPKSGSYWLHTILVQILQKSEMPIKSFIKEQPQYLWVKDRNLSFEGQAAVDMVDIEEDACYYRVSSLFRERIKDLQEYTHSTSLAWTHSSLCNMSFDILPLFDKKICIIRDPRDRALSSAKFAFTPYMQKHYPTSYSSPDSYLAGEYERLLEQWEWFIGNYLLRKEDLDIHFIFYERLLCDFEAEFQTLLDYLELPLSRSQQKEIAQNVSFSNMKNTSPGHLQQGKYGKWIRQLSEDQKKLAVEKTGSLLGTLNYSLSSEKTDSLPQVPEEIPKNQIWNRIKKIQWQDLYN